MWNSRRTGPASRRNTRPAHAVVNDSAPSRLLRILSPVTLLAALLVVSLLATAVPSGPPAAAGLVEVCHATPGGPGNFTLWINPSSVDDHLAHGDSEGPCDDASPPPSGNETDDGDKGHGNEDDSCDEDNPGQGGPAACEDDSGNETGDGDKGHGNDGDGCDDENPGQGGPPECGDGGGNTTAPASCDYEANASDVASIRVEWADGSEVDDFHVVARTTYTFFACAYDASGARVGWVDATWSVENGTLDAAWLNPLIGNYTEFKPITVGATGQIKASFNPFDVTGLLTVVSGSTGGGGSGGGGGGGGGGGRNGGTPGPGTNGPANPPIPPFVPPGQGGGLAQDLAPPVIPGPTQLAGLLIPMSLGAGAALMALYGLNRGGLPTLKVQHALPHHMRRVRIEALEPETGDLIGRAQMVEADREDGIIIWAGEIAARRKGAFRLQVTALSPDAFRVDDLGLMGLHKNEILFYQVGHGAEGPAKGPSEPPRPPVAPTGGLLEAPTTEHTLISMLGEVNAS